MDQIHNYSVFPPLKYLHPPKSKKIVDFRLSIKGWIFYIDWLSRKHHAQYVRYSKQCIIWVGKQTCVTCVICVCSTSIYNMSNTPGKSLNMKTLKWHQTPRLKPRTISLDFCRVDNKDHLFKLFSCTFIVLLSIQRYRDTGIQRYRDIEMRSRSGLKLKTRTVLFVSWYFSLTRDATRRDADEVGTLQDVKMSRR